MAFVKKNWKDRIVEFAGRRKLIRVSGDPNGVMVVDVERSEGEISEEGDAFSKNNMNDLEQRIENGFADLGGCSFVQEGEDFYIVGANELKKKLGSGELAQVSLPYTADGDYKAVASIITYVGYGWQGPTSPFVVNASIVDSDTGRTLVSATASVTNISDIHMPAGSISPSSNVTYVEKGHTYTISLSYNPGSVSVFAYLYILK